MSSPTDRCSKTL